MDTLILKSNSEEIRRTLENSNIKVCTCTSFPNALWLTYNDSVTDSVHGIGYSDETYPIPPEQILKQFIAECKSPIFCNDVNEFINKIKEQQNGNI